MRDLPGVNSAEFDVPTEVFTLRMTQGVAATATLAAIRELGYEPELLAGPATADGALDHLRNPTSQALRDALVVAQDRDVPLVVDFGASWCGLCKKLASTTLADERVVLSLKEFVFLKIDVDKDPMAVKDFGVAGIPDIWFLAPDGRVISRENRYLTPEELLAVLAEVKSSK